jgi:hypothetical protein
MISAFQSRETGFGLQISPTQMEEINESRQGKNYVDLDAAIAVHGQVGKKDLKQSPFVVTCEQILRIFTYSWYIILPV